MDWASSDLVGVFSFLLPGFVAAWIFHGLTPYPKPPQFERFIHALILTAIVNAVVIPSKAFIPNFSWTDQSTLALAVTIAVVTGTAFAFVANRDFAYRILRGIGVTTENSFPSEWYSAFSRHKAYTVLHLKGGRRLYGWAEEWPSSPEKGHFLMVEAEWLENSYERIPLEYVDTVLIPVTDVEMIELMQPKIPEEGDTGNG